MPTQALIIDEPWIGEILAGRKVWEMRSRGTTKRGPVALVRKGSGQIVAIASITDCLPPLSPGQMAMNFEKHRIPQSMVEASGYKWFTPWVLSDLFVLEKPISYKHPSGAVTWVHLTSDLQAKLSAGGAMSGFAARPDALGQGTARQRVFSESPFSRSEPDKGRATSRRQEVGPYERTMAARVFDDLRSGPEKIDVPRGANIAIIRRGNKLHISADWNDSKIVHGGAPAQRHDFADIFFALISATCTILLFFIIMAVILN